MFSKKPAATILLLFLAVEVIYSIDDKVLERKVRWETQTRPNLKRRFTKLVTSSARYTANYIFAASRAWQKSVKMLVRLEGLHYLHGMDSPTWYLEEVTGSATEYPPEIHIGIDFSIATMVNQNDDVDDESCAIYSSLYSTTILPKVSICWKVTTNNFLSIRIKFDSTTVVSIGLNENIDNNIWLTSSEVQETTVQGARLVSHSTLSCDIDNDTPDRCIGQVLIRPANGIYYQVTSKLDNFTNAH